MNPRMPHDINGFQDRRIKPLCHPSARAARRARGSSRCHKGERRDGQGETAPSACPALFPVSVLSVRAFDSIRKKENFLQFFSLSNEDDILYVMTILTEFAYFEKKSTFGHREDLLKKEGVPKRRRPGPERGFPLFTSAFSVGATCSAALGRPGLVVSSACNGMCLDRPLSGRLHHDDGGKARSAPCAEKNDRTVPAAGRAAV